MDYSKWLGYQFSTSSETGKDYLLFQREMQKDLSRIAEDNDFEVNSFHKNHYEFSAVLKDKSSEEYVYVSIPDVRFNPNQWHDHVLIRRMKHEKDWSGETNHYCKWKEIGKASRKIVERNRFFRRNKIENERTM